MISNVIFNILYQLLNIIIPLITAPYISRVMTPVEIGIYSYTNSVSGIVSVFMLLGIANYGSRTIAIGLNKGKAQLSQTFSELFSLQLISSFAGILLYGLTISFSSAEYRAGLFAQFFFLLSVALDISWFFTGSGQIKKTVMRGSLIKLVQTAAIFCCVKSPNDLITYILIMSVGTLVGNMILWGMIRKQIHFTFVPFKSLIPHIKPNLVLFIPLLASSVFVYTDKVMLGIIASSADLGLYEYAEKIVRIPLTVVSAIGTVMMPYISNLLSHNDHEACRKYMDFSMRYISLLACALFFGLLAVSQELTDVYLGADFSACGQLIQIMSCIILFSAFANILRTQWLIPRGEDKKYAGSIAGGAVINLVLNAALIPSLGSIGAAIGTIGAEATVFLLHTSAVRKNLVLSPLFMQWGRSLLYGAAMFILVEFTVSFFKTSLLKLSVGVPVGVLFFSVIALVQIRKDHFVNSKGMMQNDDTQ